MLLTSCFLISCDPAQKKSFSFSHWLHSWTDEPSDALKPSDKSLRPPWVVQVTKTEIFFNEQHVMKLPKHHSMIQTGAGAENKRAGADDLYIMPLGQLLEDAREIDVRSMRRRNENLHSSSSILIADETTPYQLFVEVLFTLGQNEFAQYELRTPTEDER